MLLACGYETVPRDWHVKDTTPPLYCRAYYVISGDVTYYAENMCTKLRHGYLYVFPSAIPHEMVQNPDNPLTCLYLHLDISPNLLTELIEIEISENSFLKHLLCAIQSGCFGKPLLGFDPIVGPLSDSLVAYLCRHNLLQTIPEELSRTILYISEHISENISLETLSQISGYHPQYYIRLFRKHLKITPHQYIINYRMRIAFYSLFHGHTVTETAALTGYPEVRNFIRAFQKHYGYAPSKVGKLLYTLP